MTDIPIRWEVEISIDEMAGFTKLLRELVIQVVPGESLKEVHIIANNALASKIRSLTGRAYQEGSHAPSAVAVAIERGNTFSSAILVRQAFFVEPGEPALLNQTSTLLEELYHCRLYHQTWQRRGYIYPHFADPYANDLFIVCGLMHDEYAVARLKNMFFGEHPPFHDTQGQVIPWFIEYGASLLASFDKVPHQLRTHGILHLVPAMRKTAMLPIAYRFIFEPLARHAGFLTPIPPHYPLQASNNNPEGSVFYREAIAPYWIPMKRALETSFTSQFSKSEEAMYAISNTIDACLDRLLEESIDSE